MSYPKVSEMSGVKVHADGYPYVMRKSPSKTSTAKSNSGPRKPLRKPWERALAAKAKGGGRSAPR